MRNKNKSHKYFRKGRQKGKRQSNVIIMIYTLRERKRERDSTRDDFGQKKSKQFFFLLLLFLCFFSTSSKSFQASFFIFLNGKPCNPKKIQKITQKKTFFLIYAQTRVKRKRNGLKGCLKSERMAKTKVG